MARFRFPLQPALDRACATETLARKVVVDARLACDDVCESLAAVESRIAELRAPARADLGPGTGVGSMAGFAGGFAAVEAALIALGVLHSRRRGEVERARGLLERAREIYARAARARGALERLRTRKLTEFERLLEAAETAQADEAGSLRSNQHSAIRLEVADEAERSSLRKFSA